MGRHGERVRTTCMGNRLPASAIPNHEFAFSETLGGIIFSVNLDFT